MNDIFKQSKKNKSIENLKDVRNNINSKWLEIKICNHLENNSLDLSIDDVKKQIMNNDLVASMFMKNPIKQNIYENISANFIKNLNIVDDFVKHPTNVKLFLYEGNIINSKKNGLKSIDFTWKTNNKNVYASQKYIDNKGGAQDNQFNDIITFLENAIKSNKNDDNIYVAIIDGDYFDEQKINILNAYKRKNVIITGTFNIEEKLKNV